MPRRRSSRRRKGNICSDLFHRIGSRYTNSISFTSEMIIPDEGEDDLGQKAKATFTFLRYSLELAYRVDGRLPFSGSFELIKESLEHIKLGEAWRHLRFHHSAKHWRNSVVKGRRAAPFVSTVEHEDSGSSAYTKMAAAVDAPNLSRRAICPVPCSQPSTRRGALPPCLRDGRCSPGVCSSWNHRRCADLTIL